MAIPRRVGKERRGGKPPLHVQVAVLTMQAKCARCLEPFSTEDPPVWNHNPALTMRPWDEATQDFIPSRNDPNFLEGVHDDCNREQATGRKRGATKTVTTRGSDIGENARAEKISKNTAKHLLKMARKQGQQLDEMRTAPHPETNPKMYLRPKRKIQSRGFEKKPKKPKRRSKR